MKKELILVLGIVISFLVFPKTDQQIISDGLGTLENMSRFEILKQECDEARLEKAKKQHPVSKLGQETDLLHDLFDDFYRCKQQRKILSAQEYRVIENECRAINSKLSLKIKELNKNYIAQSGVGIQCQTENDNSALSYITKNKKHEGDDQGDTATHWCRLTYFTSSGGRISTAVSSELFTDILEESLNGVHDYKQVSLERIKVEGLYEWMTSPKTRVGAGAYIAKIQTGRNNTFGANLQNRWHDMNGLYTLNNVSDPAIADLPQYGGGVIGTIDHVIVEKQGRFYDYKVSVDGKLELGLEGERFRSDFIGGVRTQARIEPLKGNRVSPYLGAKSEISTQSITVGNNISSDLFYGVGVEFGTNINLNSGAQLKIEASALHRSSVIENKEIEKRSDTLRNQGEANSYNIGSQQFSLQLKTSLKLPPRDLSRKQRKIQYEDMAATKNSVEEAMTSTDDLEEYVKYKEVLETIEKRMSDLERIDPRLIKGK